LTKQIIQDHAELIERYLEESKQKIDQNLLEIRKIKVMDESMNSQ